MHGFRPSSTPRTRYDLPRASPVVARAEHGNRRLSTGLRSQSILPPVEWQQSILPGARFTKPAPSGSSAWASRASDGRPLPLVLLP